MTGEAIILYDGTCGFCDRTVQFVLSRDRHKLFRFAPLQNEFAREILRRHNLDPNDLSTVVAVFDHGTPQERVEVKGRGALVILSKLGGIWSVLGLLRFLPRFLLDFGYSLIARNRYRFGRLDSCRLPSPEERHRFIL